MRPWIRQNRGLLVFLLLLGCFRTAVADWNPIPSGSMRPTLLEGDVVLVNRLAYNLKLPLTNIVLERTGEPRRGDIVTFFSPKDGTRLIKRLVALPGDRVEMRHERLLVNGMPASYQPNAAVSESFGAFGAVDALRLTESLQGRHHAVQWLHLPNGLARDSFGPLVIPPDHFFMLGDNRDDSEDSRYIGTVPRKLLIGRAHHLLVSADIKKNWHPRLRRFGMALR